MPVYEIEFPAKIIIKMGGSSPEEAIKNLDSLLEDFYMQIPCGGHSIKFGDYPAEVWGDCENYKVRREMPEGYDPKNPPKFSMAAYMKMCFEPIEMTEEEANELDKLLNKEGGAKGQELPLADKDALLRKVEDVQ